VFVVDDDDDDDDDMYLCVFSCSTSVQKYPRLFYPL